MATMVVVQPKQPSFSVLQSSVSDFNGVKLAPSVQYKRKVWQPRGALKISASAAKKILVMGGTRFIGIFLSRLLVKEGHQVTLFTRGKAPISQQLPGESDADYAEFSSKILHLKGDRQDFDFVKSSLAAEGFDVVYDINGREAVEVEPILDALPNLEQYIYCSSAGVYLKTDYPPHFEVDAVDPKSRHKGKLETESLLDARGVNWTSLRPVYIYGPLNYNPVEEWFFHRLKAGRPIPIPTPGLQITQLGHVKDLAKAFVLVLGNEKASREVFNISGEKYVTFDGLAKACAKAGGFPEPEIIHYKPKDYDFGKKKAFPFRDQHFFASVEKAKSVLGWKPEFDLVEGLTDSYNLDFGRGTFRKAADFSTDDIILGKSLVSV
ncbi:OLC1v1002103C1 [Oldenlandia corymbosa var. corymbosa]|uniref:OLC1v1002103C1 n=1 Tax=Oldenlandia corymbosa var. corymbosa TaxID=529605 RepID=A0AAV1D964_OLDCO|nr:OLC1v1002103C1 [Oldenlandia corymbosa var. corymbosa]